MEAGVSYSGRGAYEMRSVLSEDDMNRYLYVLIYPDEENHPSQMILGFDNLRPTLPLRTYPSILEFRLDYITGKLNSVGYYPDPTEIVVEIDLWEDDDTVECGCCGGTHPREQT